MQCRYRSVPVLVKVFSFCFFNPDTKKHEAVAKQVPVSALVGTEAQTQLLYERVFELEAERCEKQKEANAIVPEWWQVRIGGDRPQLAITYANKEPDGSIGKSRWALHIPHYQGAANVFPNLSGYTKGQHFAIATLKDNSKIWVNATSKDEAERICSELLSMVDSQFLPDTNLIHTGQRKGQELVGVEVVPIAAAYFSTGQKDVNPDWIAYPEDSP